MNEIIVCLVAGIAAGIGTGFAGMSAATIISPMLVTLLGVNVYTAIGIALASDILASAISAYNYKKNKNIDIKNSKNLFISILVFTIVGTITSKYISIEVMDNITLYASIILGINFIIKSFNKPKKYKFIKCSETIKKILPIICGMIIGFICGFVGAGGGIMMLILLTVVLDYDLKNAVGTSVFIMTFTALIGSASHFCITSSFPSLTMLSVCVLATFISSLIASKIAINVDNKILYQITGSILIILGIFMIITKTFF